MLIHRCILLDFLLWIENKTFRPCILYGVAFAYRFFV